MWLGYQQAIGARKAGRFGTPLLSIRRATVAAYLEGLAEGGRDDVAGAPRRRRRHHRGRRSRSCLPADAPHYLYQINSYSRAAGRPVHQLEDLGDRRGEGRARVAIHLTVLTVDEAIAEVRRQRRGSPVEHVYTWSTVAEMPDDIAARHRELWLGPVRDALTT